MPIIIEFEIGMQDYKTSFLPEIFLQQLLPEIYCLCSWNGELAVIGWQPELLLQPAIEQLKRSIHCIPLHELKP